MEVIWHPSRGRKHWNSEPREWLCLRETTRSLQSVKEVHLEEGTHHSFEDLHIYDASGKQHILSRSLDGPVPFDIDIEEILHVAGANDCLILVSTRFFPFSKAPFQAPAQQMSEINCGFVTKRDGSTDPLLMHIHAEATGMNPAPAALPSIESALGIFRTVVDLPIVELSLGDLSAVPFHLKDPAPLDTLVFLFNDQQTVDRGILPGLEVEIARIGQPGSSLTISAGQYAPGRLIPVRGYTIALPVLQKNIQTAIVGKPLAIGKLISGLLIEALGNDVSASWTWHGPDHWLRVRITWDFYFNETDPQTGRSRTIWYEAESPDEPKREHWMSIALYNQQFGLATLPFERSQWRRWTAEIRVTPFLLDNEVSEQTLTDHILL